MIKSNGVGELKSLCKILVRKPEVALVMRRKGRWEDIIKVDLKETV
jgi:hypothetical protein